MSLCTLYCLYFFFNDTATTEIYTLSLHDALPIWERLSVRGVELLHALLHQDRKRDGRDDKRQDAVAYHRIHHQPLEQQAEHQKRDGEASQHRHRERQAAEFHRREDEKGGQHHELALREVDRLRRLPQEHEADGDQRVNAAGREASQQQLQSVRQRFTSRLLAQLGQGLDDLLLALDDFGQEADAVDVAVVIPSGLHQDAGLLLGLDGEAVQRLGEQLAIEPADLLGRVLDRVHAGVALDAVMVRHVAEALVEFLLERQHGRNRRVGRKAYVPARAIRGRARHVDHLLPEQRRSEERRVGKECRSRWSPYH